jgi:hypothetical protein
MSRSRPFVQSFLRLKLSEKTTLFEKYALPLGDPSAPEHQRWTLGLVTAKKRGVLPLMAQDMGLDWRDGIGADLGGPVIEEAVGTKDAQAGVEVTPTTKNYIAVQVPEGYVVVPREPTMEMIENGLIGLVEEIQRIWGPPPTLTPAQYAGEEDIPEELLARRYMHMGSTMRSGLEVKTAYQAMVKMFDKAEAD